MRKGAMRGEFESAAMAPAAETRAADPLPADGTIGGILVAAGRLSAEDARRVAAAQETSPEPFGRMAVRLGLVTEADLQYALAQQFSLPCLAPQDPSVDPEVIAAFHPEHEWVESLRELRARVWQHAAAAMPPLRSLAILGCGRGSGRSRLAANLATVFAQLGARTLLVDADFAHPRQHELFRVGNRAGLSTILSGRATLSAVCRVPALPGFAVLPSGPRPPNPQDLLERPTLAQLLRRCEQDFDVVVLDTPAWEERAGAAAVAAAARSGVLVVRQGRTRTRAALSVAQGLEHSGARLLGVALDRR
jgi:protein-tyrosine kinase